MSPAGCYTTAGVVSGRPRFAERHVRRLRRDAEKLGLDAPSAEVCHEALATLTAEAFPDGEGIVRLELRPDARGRARLVGSTRPLGDEPRVLSAVVSDVEHPGPGPALGAKLCARSVFEEAFERARRVGAQEALLVDREAWVVEGARTNVAGVDAAGVAWTPPLARGAVGGLAREIVLESLGSLCEMDVPREALASAREIVVLNAVRGARPVVRLDGRPVDPGSPAPSAPSSRASSPPPAEVPCRPVMNLGTLALTIPVPFHDARASVELAQRAEKEWGYDALWLAETAGPDSFTLAGALAQATSRVTIGTAIVPVYNRSPAVLAMSAGALAQLSGDRFVLGLGSSSHAIIGDWNGIPFERPLTYVRESVELIRQALSGGKTDYAGEVFRSKGLRLGSPPGRPVPIYLAALRERMLQLAGELGEGLIVNLFPRSALPRMLGAYREGARRAGRDASGDEVVCRFQVAVTDDVETARRMFRAVFSGYFAAPVYNAYLAWCGFEDEARGISDAFARKDRAGNRGGALGRRRRPHRDPRERRGLSRAGGGLRGGRRDDARDLSARSRPRLDPGRLRGVRAGAALRDPWRRPRRSWSPARRGSWGGRWLRRLPSGVGVRLLTRRARDAAPGGPEPVVWNGCELPEGAVDGARAVVHLSGEPIFGGVPTAVRRRRMVASRVDSTASIVAAIGRRPAGERPEVLVCASAVGIYGDRRGRGAHRERGAGRRLPGEAVRGLGGGGARGREPRRARGLAAHRSGAGAGGRRARGSAPALRPGSWRPARQRPAVDALDPRRRPGPDCSRRSARTRASPGP